MGFTGRWLSCYCHYSKRNLYSSNSQALGALMNTLRTQASPVRLKVQQGRAGGFAAGVAADHAAALFPAALAFDLVGGRAILGHAPGHAHPDRRQLVLPVATTIFAGRDGVIIRYGGTVDYRPTNQAIEAETYGRQDTGNGSGQGWDERAFSAQVAEWPIAVAGETGASVAHSARSLRRGVGG